jgi:hypothetical protein
MDPMLLNVILAAGGALLPALLKKLNLNIPILVPQPDPVPQLPTVDAPLQACFDLLGKYEAKQVVPDTADLAAMAEIKAKIIKIIG